jgi:hypothetical protein
MIRVRAWAEWRVDVAIRRADDEASIGPQPAAHLAQECILPVEMLDRVSNETTRSTQPSSSASARASARRKRRLAHHPA